MFVIIAINHKKNKNVNLRIDVNVNCENIPTDTIKTATDNPITKKRKKVQTALSVPPKNHIQYVIYIILVNNIKKRSSSQLCQKFIIANNFQTFFLPYC